MMDPNAALAELRTAAWWAKDHHRAAELFTALDEWLSKGGFPPEAWTKNQTVTVHVVQRATIDGLYGFADEGQADAYAEVFDDADRGTLEVVVDLAQGAQMIEDARAEMQEEEADAAYVCVGCAELVAGAVVSSECLDECTQDVDHVGYCDKTEHAGEQCQLCNGHEFLVKTEGEE